MLAANTAKATDDYASRREIFGWAMFDFANQAYTLLIITVVFGELFTTVIVGIVAITSGLLTSYGVSVWPLVISWWLLRHRCAVR